MAVEKIETMTQDLRSADAFYEEAVVFDAVMMNFIVIGEMVDKLSTKYKHRHKTVEWNALKDFRNMIAHDYFGIDAEEVWQVIQDYLPKFKPKLRQLIHQKTR